MKELVLQAALDNISKATAFIDEQLELCDCSIKAQMQIDVAIDELFANISSYAYRDQTESRDVRIRFSYEEGSRMATIVLMDHGIPFNPLDQEDPDTHLPIEERDIGGLGIFLVKKTMDHMDYRYEEGWNIVTIQKTI